MPIFMAFLQAIIFQFFGQNAKRLQEEGITALTILSYLRYAFLPSLVLLVLFWDQQSALMLLGNSELVFIFLGFILLQSAFQFFFFASRHLFRSLALVSTVLRAFGLPLVLLTGFLINRDTPSLFIIIAVILLTLAIFIKPNNHQNNTKNKPLYSIPVIAGLIISYLLLQALKDPLYREFMRSMPNVLFAIALSMCAITLFINIFFLGKRLIRQRKEQQTKSSLLLVSIPILWILGSIPEAYSFSHIPIFMVTIIGAVTFFMSLVSDLYHRRISFGLRTGFFSVLVLIAIALTVFASSS